MMASIPLLLADAADLVLSSLLGPKWGVYLNGEPIISPASAFGSQVSSLLGPLRALAPLVGVAGLLPVSASTVDFEFSRETPISTYPQEQGAFQSYDKVTLPFDVKLKLAAGGPTPVRQAFINTCLGISESINLYDIQTPEKVFTSCNCIHIDWPRKADSGLTLIRIDLWFKQVVVKSATAFSSTKNPTDAGTQALGNAQPVSGVPFASNFGKIPVQ